MKTKYEPGHRSENTPHSNRIAAKEKDIILVVEDNAIARLQIKSALEPDFIVIEAADGKEGILEAMKTTPDLIVSDIVMEEIDGIELCRVLKNHVLTSHIPIILMSVRVSEDSLLEGLDTGADDYIAKPFSSSLLLARVKNLIDLRHQLQLERTGRMTIEPKPLDISPIDEAFYSKLQYILEDHLADTDFNVEALCRLLGISQPSLYRKVRGITGYSPVQFIRSYRLKRAAQLLQAGAGSISEVAAQVGFPSLPYFCRCFKQHFNGLPSDFQVNCQRRCFNEQFNGLPSDFQVNCQHRCFKQQFNGSPSDFQVNCRCRCFKEQFNGLPPNFQVHCPPEEECIDPSTENEILSKSVKPGLPDGEDGPVKDVVMVIEDNDEVREHICQLLTPLYQVVEAEDSSEGISRAVDIIPDLIICDTSTPGNEDFQVCQRLKQDVNTSHIPIMLLTGSASEDHIIQGLNLGVDDYMIKPFNSRVLHARIRNLIEQRRRLQLIRHREMALMPSHINESLVEREFIKDLNRVMRKYYSHPNLTVEYLAEKLYMSSASLYRKIRALSGQSPGDYIRNYRLDRAAELLKNHFGTITEVAFEVGFKNRTHFSRCFKERFHQLPSAYGGTIPGRK